jgi:hypothetical protein
MGNMYVKCHRIILLLVLLAIAIGAAACGEPSPMTWAG